MNEDREMSFLVGTMIGAMVIIVLLFLLVPSRACSDDFPSRGDVVYFWPGRMILPPESSVTEWKEAESELSTDPAPQCVPENAACEFPAEKP